MAAGEAHQRVARGTNPVPVRVTATGYEQVEVTVAPDRDRALVLALSPISAPAGSAPPKAAKIADQKPGADSSGVIKRYPF